MLEKSKSASHFFPDTHTHTHTDPEYELEKKKKNRLFKRNHPDMEEYFIVIQGVQLDYDGHYHGGLSGNRCS